MSRTIKVVFPVAGMGTRSLPASGANPKEMMPVVDKPLIQCAVEEALAAGMTEMIFVAGRKRTIEDHFDTAFELETEREKRGQAESLKMVRSIVPSRLSYLTCARTVGARSGSPTASRRCSGKR